MPALFTFTDPYKSFPVDESTTMELPLAAESNVAGPTDLRLTFTYGGTAVRDTDYRVLESPKPYSTPAPGDPTWGNDWLEVDVGESSTSWACQVLDQNERRTARSIVLTLDSASGSDGSDGIDTDPGSRGRISAVAYIAGNPRLGLGFLPTMYDIPYIPNWAFEPTVNFNVPVSASRNDRGTEQRLTTYDNKTHTLPDGFEYIDLDFERRYSITFSQTADRNVGFMHDIWAHAGAAGFWLPFFAEPLIGYSDHSHTSDADSVVVVEGGVDMLRRLSFHGPRILRIDRTDPSVWEALPVAAGPEEYLRDEQSAEDRRGGVIPVVGTFSETIAAGNEVFFFMDAVGVSNLSRQPLTDDVADFPVEFVSL